MIRRRGYICRQVNERTCDDHSAFIVSLHGATKVSGMLSVWQVEFNTVASMSDILTYIVAYVSLISTLRFVIIINYITL